MGGAARRLLLATAMAVLAPGWASAQPCVLDKCLTGAPATTTPARPDGVAPEGSPASTNDRALRPRIGPRAPGNFDFYVLALSWSPGFCDTGGAAKAPGQCAAGSGLGFVVHGLWPQYTRGFPSDCDAGARTPPRAALDLTRGVYPDIGLARYEWRKHGTCTGLAPTEYFAAVKQARDGITIPEAFRQPDEPSTMAPLDIARAFAAANPGLRPDMMAVTCRQDELEEVRLCLAKDLRGFVSCPEVARGVCRTRAVTVLPLR